ncbi:MAG: PH domain-containing protein [Clostridia bacterium]|nr:PH domain-containing protein [Clostridia bacterium]
MELQPINYLWKDRKRYFGLPLSFTRYSLSEDRIFLEKGFLNINADEVLLYRVRDLELNLKLTQRIFGVGTVWVPSSDQSTPHLELKNVKKPREVKEMIHRAVEEAKEKRSMRTMEIMGGANGGGEMKEMDLFDEEHLLDDDISE